MKNSKVNGSPISQNVRNVNTFSENISKSSPIPQNDRFVNPFSEKFFEVFVAQKLSDVKSFLKYFSENPEAYRQWATVQNIKTMANTLNFLTEHNLLDYVTTINFPRKPKLHERAITALELISRK